MAVSTQVPLHGLVSFLESGHFTDFTIKCQGYEWKVHKVIISAECGFFRKICQSNFKVSNLMIQRVGQIELCLSRSDISDRLQEAVENTVDFPDDDPKSIARLILFLYTEYYPVWIKDANDEDSSPRTAEWFGCLQSLLDSSRRSVDSENVEDAKVEQAGSMAIDASVHALADRLDIPKLAVEARKPYLQARNRLTENGLLPELWQDFFNSVKIVYDTTLDTRSQTQRRVSICHEKPAAGIADARYSRWRRRSLDGHLGSRIPDFYAEIRHGAANSGLGSDHSLVRDMSG